MTTAYHACAALCNGVRPEASDTPLGELDELGWHRTREPHGAGRAHELEAGRPHAARRHAQHDRMPTPSPNGCGRAGICRQVHVLAHAGDQPFGLDGHHRCRRGPMAQDRRRLARLDPEVDRNGVAVVGPDAARGVAGETLLVARLGNVEDKTARKRHPMRSGALDELVDIYPALGIEREADALWLMPQNAAQESADVL